MAKMMFWVGYFPTEEDFEKYMDQTEFYQWWSKYQNSDANSVKSLEYHHTMKIS